MKKFNLILIIAIINTCYPNNAKLFQVNIAVTDLRIKPIQNKNITVSKNGFDSDMNQSSQLLYGELVKLINEDRNWSNILALEQLRFSNNKLTPISGYVESKNLTKKESILNNDLVVKVPWTYVYSQPYTKSPIILELSFGTNLHSIDKSNKFYKVELIDGKIGYIQRKDINYLPDLARLSNKKLRKNFIKYALRYLGMPYAWGGRSAYNPKWNGKKFSSVDCSGLTNLCYRACGINVPKNSHDQFLTTRKINNLVPGDVVFYAKPKTRRVVHVLIYLGNDKLVSADGLAPRKTCIETFTKKFGISYKKIQYGDLLTTISNPQKQFIVYLGTHFAE